MDLPGHLQSALGSADRFEPLLGRGSRACVWFSHDLSDEWPR
jgi:hypothetical protein